MDDLLFLAHRIPYPPNKGDKIRAFHILEHLRQHFRVHLGCFVDDPADLQFVERLRSRCASACFVPLNPAWARVASLRRLFSAEALSLPYYRHPRMKAWVEQTLADHPISTGLAFSTPMAQYLPPDLHRVLDMVDVDSEKWRAYAETQAWPLSACYRREARQLQAYEHSLCADFDQITLVSQAEAALLRESTPQSDGRISAFSNGTDADYFSPQITFPNPYPTEQLALVFTGAMDYWPNIDAVQWFARQILPELRQLNPALVFYIVGARPSHQVTALRECAGVTVTGAVADVRPYLQHAALAVAPLRIARGIQNKVLEAMAMQQAVVATPQALEGISADREREVIAAPNREHFVQQISALLRDLEWRNAVGLAARRRILTDYRWAENLRHLESLLQRQRASQRITS